MYFCVVIGNPSSFHDYHRDSVEGGSRIRRRRRRTFSVEPQAFTNVSTGNVRLDICNNGESQEEEKRE